MIVNCAFASDGGSIWLALNDNGQGAAFKLNRSIGSRGTSNFEAITDDSGAAVEGAGLVALLATLTRQRVAMSDDDRCRRAVDEFISVLRQKSDSPPKSPTIV